MYLWIQKRWKALKAWLCWINEPFAVEFLEFPDDMPAARRYFLEQNPHVSLTKQEVEQGYRFCCEWDGLLIHHTHFEARFCSCLKECGYRIKTQEEWQKERECL